MKTGKRETLQAMFYSVFSKIFTYLLLFVFANFYLPEEYGLASFVFNIRNIVMLFVFLGLPDALVPFIVQKRKINSIIRFLFLINIPILLIGILFIFIKPWIWPLVMAFPMVMVTSIAMSFWRAKAIYSFPVKIGVFSVIITLISAYFLKDYGKLGIVASYSLGNFFSFLVLVYPLRKELIKSIQKSQEPLGDFKKYLLLGISITFVGSIFVFVNWIDSTILGIFGSFAMVAEFGVASAIAGIIAIIPTTLSMFMITRASQISGKEMSRNVFYRVTRVSFLVSLLTSILLVIFSSLLVDVFFPRYDGIETYIAILSVGMVFFSSYYIIYSYHIGKMNVNKTLLPVIVGLLANVLLSILLIPKFGVAGVSFSTSLTHFVIFLFLGYKENMKRIMFMSLFAVFLVWTVHWTGYLGIVIFIITIPSSLFLKIITLEDVKVIKETFFSFFKTKK